MDGVGRDVLINIGGWSIIATLVGVIYRNVCDKISKLTDSAVSKDVCNEIQGNFCREIAETKEYIKDMRKEVLDGMKEIKQEIKNGNRK